MSIDVLNVVSPRLVFGFGLFKYEPKHRLNLYLPLSAN